MRLMLRLTIPVQKGNEAAADGSMQSVIQDMAEKLQPEALYFHLQDGKRALTAIFESEDQAEMVLINEPLFVELDAEIDIQPVLNLEDLIRAL